METRCYLFWQQIFNRSSTLSNRAFDVAFAAAIGCVVSLVLLNVTETTWLTQLGIGSLAIALISAALGFIAQTTTQTAHCVGNAIAKRNGIKPRAFKQGKPMFAKFIAHKFTTKRTIARSHIANISTRNNARAARSASRSTFSGASNASKSSKGNSDDGGSSDSGSSDSGSEPLPLSTSTPFIPLCTQKQHRNTVQERVSKNCACLITLAQAGRCPA